MLITSSSGQPQARVFCVYCVSQYRCHLRAEGFQPQHNFDDVYVYAGKQQRGGGGVLAVPKAAP